MKTISMLPGANPAPGGGFKAAVVSPGGAIDATTIASAWLNSLETEDVNLLAAAGLVPDGEDLAQLLEAVQFLGGGGAASVPSDLVDGGGAIVKGGVYNASACDVPWVALGDADGTAGETVSMRFGGIATATKVLSTETWAAGDPVFWNPTTLTFTDQGATAGTKFAGVAAAASASGQATAPVALMPRPELALTV